MTDDSTEFTVPGRPDGRISGADDGPGGGPVGAVPSGPSASSRPTTSFRTDSFRTDQTVDASGNTVGRRVSPPAGSAESARALFGERLPIAEAYADLLATDGVVRGLIGPREAPRIWERHVLNCAVVAELIPPNSSVLDVGSGAGLPGIVLAVARPDLSVVLIEPLARRTAFLTEVVAELGLEESVTVVRGRAEEIAADPSGVAAFPGDVVTARAVAPLDRLARWCLPLASAGGRLLALKGSSAADEVAEHRAAVHRLGGSEPVVKSCGVGLIDPPTTVVEIVRERVVGAAARPARRAARGRQETVAAKGGREGSRRR